MPVAARVSPKDFFSDQEWAPLSARSSWKGLALVAHAWAAILATGAVAVIWPNPLTITLAVMIIGARQLGIAILMHDAAHACLHPNLKINDWVAEWLCSAPVGASLARYRPYHLSHHKFAQQSEDPDLGLSKPFPISRKSLHRKMIRDLTGQTFYKQRIGAIFAAYRQGKAKGVPRETITKGVFAFWAPFLIVNGAAIAMLSLAGLWWVWPVLWLLPMATWYPLITRLRNIAEHACIAEGEPDPLRHARTTHANILERIFIAPYWVNYHCEHHMFMHMPCWSLPKAHRLLAAKGVTERMEVRQGYAAVLATAASA